MSFNSGNDESDYVFDITKYSDENLDRISERIRKKGRGHTWDFFDPEDLANLALRKLWIYTIKHPDCCLDKERIDKTVSKIVVRHWNDEVRRELKETNLVGSGSGSVCVSLFAVLDLQGADLGLDFEVALRELLDHVKTKLTSRQKSIVDLLVEGLEESELASKLRVSDSTVDREIKSIKKKIVSRLGEDCEQRTTNNEQRTTNNEQRTTNNEQRTTNNEQRTTNNEQRGCNPP